MNRNPMIDVTDIYFSFYENPPLRVRQLESMPTTDLGIVHKSGAQIPRFNSMWGFPSRVKHG